MAGEVHVAQERPDRIHLTLFVPGKAPDVAAWQRALAAQGISADESTLTSKHLPFQVGLEWVDNPRDGSFGKSFSQGTATDTEQNAIELAGGALVLTFPVDLHRQRANVVGLVRALAECGALAVRVEESKLGWPVKRWIDLVDGHDPWTLYRAVVVVLTDRAEAGTCGMHVFSFPDAQVSLDEQTDMMAANTLLGSLSVYQLAEDSLIQSGNTFQPDAGTPRRVLHRWPDARYARGHVCHNPFGVWRLGAAGTQSEPTRDLPFEFIPALVVLLEASEKKAGRPLTRAEVENIVANGTGIIMEPRDVQELERSRGYADLDPEHAWEQWQIARRTE